MSASTNARPVLGRGLLLLMATATGLAVAGNYFAQPLLDLIGRELGFGAGRAALIVTAAQVGYALGLILLVPLGDLLERRGLATGLFAATAVFLLVAGAAPNGGVLLAATALTALTSVAAQVIVPFAVTLAEPGQAGRVVGTVMTGLLLGALLARTVSGLLAELGGWRTAYFVNAALVAVVAVLLWRRLPRLHTPVGLRYPALLRSTVALLRTEPVLRRRSALAALSLASFNTLWTAVTFLLVGHYGWSEGAIGLFGLVGVVGVAVTPVAGRLGDRGLGRWVTGAGAGVMVLAWGALAAGGESLLWLLVGVVALNAAHTAVLNSNQNAVYALRPEIRNRLNSVLMTSFFAGGALGSALTSVVWVRAGWGGVSVLGVSLAVAMFLLWATERRPAAAQPGARPALAAVTVSAR